MKMTRPTGIQKKSNEYAAAIIDYNDIPKAVFAAVAVSRLTSGGDRMDGLREAFMEEWRILHANGIIPQPPIK